MIERRRSHKRLVALRAAPIIGCLWASLALALICEARQSTTATPDTSHLNQTPAPETSSSLPRGKKLALKDGSFQLVREYQVNGDRVRYYSLDSSQWEEIPASLVDWEATKKIEGEEAQRDAAFAARVYLREQGRNAEALDIDESVEVAPGVFLPPGEGLFLFDGLSIERVAQAQTSSTLDKKHLVAQVLVPIPIPTRHDISVDGPHSLLRIRGSQLEFYKRSGNGVTPDLRLVRGKVHSNSREFEQLYELFGERAVNAKTVPIQSWEIAPGLFRFTLGKDLAPGEYAIAEVIPGDEKEIYLWDFGFDLNGEPVVRAK